MLHIQDLQIRHLAALRAVAQEGSFSRAAERLGFSQSAISQQISGLERVLGEPVFDRPGGPRKAELTPAGRVLLRHAETILDRLEQAGQELVDLRAGTSGRLVIGTFQSVSVKLLPTIIGLMLLEAPGLEIRLVETDYQEELAGGLHSGELDVAFMVGPVRDEQVETVELRRDPYVVVLPGEQGEFAPDPYPLAALVGVPMVGQQSCSCQDLIDDGLRAGGVAPNYVFRSNDNGAVQAMVRAGMGPAVLPMLAVDMADTTVAIRSLDPPLEPRSILLATRRGRTQAAAATRLIELAISSCQALNQQHTLVSQRPVRRRRTPVS